MKKKIKLRSRRIFSEDFKRARVGEYEKGDLTVKEIADLYQVDRAMIYRWIFKYSTYNKKKYKIVENSESSFKKLKDMQERIKELEQALGRKQLKIDYLEKMIEIAKDEYDIDIKKNSDTPRSNGSRKTGKK